jgi:CubicO group peptidase (beta-lactamase class C family)
MTRLRVPGVAVGVHLNGEDFTAGYGVTSVDHPLAVNPGTLFLVGSTTKTVTATALMRLVETQRLQLDAPVRTYLPELRLSNQDVTASVTLRHLLTHTGGWEGDYFEDTGDGEDALARIVSKLSALPQRTPLGEVWSYNNAGFYIAGRLLEVVTAQTYEAAVRSLVLEPLGMKHSFFSSREIASRRFAVGHTVHDDGPHVSRPVLLSRSVNPIGGLVSSLEDQMRYARFHLGDGTAVDGTRLLRSETMAFMQSALEPAGSIADNVGVSWLLRDFGSTRLVMHGGTLCNQLSAFVLVPERNFAVTVLTNANRGGELHREITDWILEHCLGVTRPQLSPLPLNPRELEAYIGGYAMRDFRLHIWLEATGLQAQVVPARNPENIPVPGAFPLAVWDTGRVSPQMVRTATRGVSFCATQMDACSSCASWGASARRKSSPNPRATNPRARVGFENRRSQHEQESRDGRGARGVRRNALECARCAVRVSLELERQPAQRGETRRGLPHGCDR